MRSKIVMVLITYNLLYLLPVIVEFYNQTCYFYGKNKNLGPTKDMINMVHANIGSVQKQEKEKTMKKDKKLSRIGKSKT